MIGELYRLKTSRDEGREDTLTHEGREWVGACALTEYSFDTEILIDTEKWLMVVLFKDLYARLENEGVWLI
jgi:hypothetical protein